jgi:hypothetical protein
MARLYDDASSEYTKIDQAVVSAVPFAASVWFRRDADVECVPFCIVDKDSDVHSFIIQCLVSGEGGGVRALVQDAGGSGVAVTSTSITDNVWQHACGLFVSDTDRRIFLNGGGKGTNAVDRTPANMDRTAIGYWGRQVPVHYFTGDIAEVAVWDLSEWPGATASDKADGFENIVSSLADGYSPSIFSLGLKAYWPLVRELNDNVGGFNLTASGTAVSNHPKVIYPNRIWLRHRTPVPSSSVSTSVSSSVSASTSASVSASLSASISSSVSASISSSASSTPSSSISASPSISSSVSSSISSSVSSSPSISASVSSSPSVSSSISASASASVSASPSPMPSFSGYANYMRIVNGKVISAEWIMLNTS